MFKVPRISCVTTIRLATFSPLIGRQGKSQFTKIFPKIHTTLTKLKKKLMRATHSPTPVGLGRDSASHSG